ncbi:hypothetical protein [Streptomyces himalayensis]|uniref:Uncharacterized protein n=1 Tax=Streptomyces himalayensis subsp. himalayensis TaxID=2756131 RepID=A0A7W0I9D7_9ACTN|nr:hypothetical protein [Streptomyces himalayensis]MBA2947270.1 hypothetical protein [Streptomyces himalayensis subsp. himalayensis]
MNEPAHGDVVPPCSGRTYRALEALGEKPRAWGGRLAALPQQRGDRFVAHTGFAPRTLATPYRWFRTSPRRIQARREVNEPPDRELTRDGRRLV